MSSPAWFVVGGTVVVGIAAYGLSVFFRALRTGVHPSSIHGRYRVRRDGSFRFAVDKRHDETDATSWSLDGGLTSRDGKLLIRQKIALDLRRVESLFFYDDGFETGFLSHLYMPLSRKWLLTFTERRPTDADGGVTLTLASWSFDDDLRRLMAFPFPTDYHHAGCLRGHPSLLHVVFLSCGDGGPQGDPEQNAQKDSGHRGKLLWIDLNEIGSAPYRVYAKGMRNPWQFDVDANLKQILISDTGWGTSESFYRVPLLEKGPPDAPFNLGWPFWEGTVPLPTQGPAPNPSGFVFPFFEYPTGSETGRAAVGIVYLPFLGAFVVADYTGVVRVIDADGYQVAKGRMKANVNAVTKLYPGESAALLLTSKGAYRLSIHRD